MTAADWATAASLATALRTLVLAVATFSAVRLGNRTARAAELSLLTTPSAAPYAGLSAGGTAAEPRLASSEDHPVGMLTVTRQWNIGRPDPRRGDRPVTP